MFELWVEHQKVIGNLSLPDAISAFFHLCFVAHLEYPKVRCQFFFCILIICLRELGIW